MRLKTIVMVVCGWIALTETVGMPVHASEENDYNYQVAAYCSKQAQKRLEYDMSPGDFSFMDEEMQQKKVSEYFNNCLTEKGYTLEKDVNYSAIKYPLYYY